MVNLLVRKYPAYLIVNLDKLDYCASLKSLKAVYGCSNYRFVKVSSQDAHSRHTSATLTAQGSITSSDLVTFVMSTYNIDTVMHFAAQSHVGACREPVGLLAVEGYAHADCLPQIILLAIPSHSRKTTSWAPTCYWKPPNCKMSLFFFMFQQMKCMVMVLG